MHGKAAATAAWQLGQDETYCCRMQATILVVCGLQVDHDAALVKQHTPALSVLLYFVPNSIQQYGPMEQ